MRKLNISIGVNRWDKEWVNCKTSFEDLVAKLSKTTRTNETVSQYASYDADRQSKIKDIGGFVLGIIKDGRRLSSNIVSRSALALDLDYATTSTWESLKAVYKGAMCIYSTHKHTNQKPRLRLIVPLDRDVTAEEYEAIGRKFASSVGLDYFDDTTYQASRLMYWPSTSKDGEYFFDCQYGECLEADSVLTSYSNWQDVSEWPRSEREESNRNYQRITAKAQQDPLSKDGFIGAFCKVYSIQDAIDKYLPGIYSACRNNRYTYIKGTTFGGMVVYDNKFAYSNHSTDPANGKLCNAFDLVRVHLFGHLDIDVPENTEVMELPSFKKMQKLISADNLCMHELVVQGTELPEDAENDWLYELTYSRGKVEPTINNIILICRHDTRLKGLGRYDLFCNRIEANPDLPWTRHLNVWTDSDTAGLLQFIEKYYKISAKSNIEIALERVFTDNAYNPVKDYLNNLTWDKTPRLDRLLIDYLGADDTPYIKEVTRKTLVAGVKRIFEPGCEFQQCLVLCGVQGCGKSYLAYRLGGKYFSDAPGNLTQNSKEKYENLDGVWVMEWPENNMSRKVEKEAVRAFISMKIARYRPAYGKRVIEKPIQNITIVTTNDVEFLAEYERRHWIVNLHGKTPRVATRLKDLSNAFFDQIWAEAKHYYKLGEDINSLSDTAKNEHELLQKAHIYEDEWQGVISDFLEKDIPENWYSMTVEAQIGYINGSVTTDAKIVRRDRVCTTEIADILFPREKKDTWRIKKILEKIDGWEYSTKGVRFGRFGVLRGFARVL